MKFYTKEWYDLMQHLHYTCGVRKIPDKEYSDKEIKGFYDRALKKEVARERKFHNARISCEGKDGISETKNCSPFDPTATIKYFKDGYRFGIRYAACRYPEWVVQSVDKRLLALNLMPESVYRQLKQEEQKNRRVFKRIEKKAEEVLSEQEIPEKIRKSFRFHDSYLLTLRKTGKDVELYVHKFLGRKEGKPPYIKVIFKNVTLFDKEKGLVIRKRMGRYGEWESNCQFLYKEFYRTECGYEVHMLLWTRKKLRYLTIGCEEIVIEDNIQL